MGREGRSRSAPVRRRAERAPSLQPLSLQHDRTVVGGFHDWAGGLVRLDSLFDSSGRSSPPSAPSPAPVYRPTSDGPTRPAACSLDSAKTAPLEPGIVRGFVARPILLRMRVLRPQLLHPYHRAFRKEVVADESPAKKLLRRAWAEAIVSEARILP